MIKKYNTSYVLYGKDKTVFSGLFDARILRAKRRKDLALTQNYTIIYCFIWKFMIKFRSVLKEKNENICRQNKGNLVTQSYRVFHMTASCNLFSVTKKVALFVR